MKTFQTIISAALSLMVVALIGCNKQKGTVIDHSEGANGGDISNYTVYEETKPPLLHIYAKATPLSANPPLSIPPHPSRCNGLAVSATPM